MLLLEKLDRACHGLRKGSKTKEAEETIAALSDIPKKAN